jgi:hypothetical protein
MTPGLIGCLIVAIAYPIIQIWIAIGSAVSKRRWIRDFRDQSHIIGHDDLTGSRHLRDLSALKGFQFIWFERDLGEITVDSDVRCHSIYVEEGTKVLVTGHVFYRGDIYGDGLLKAAKGRVGLEW